MLLMSFLLKRKVPNNIYNSKQLTNLFKSKIVFLLKQGKRHYL